MVQGKINRGRHTGHPAGRHYIRTSQCPPSPSPPPYFLQAGCPFCRPTKSVKALKATHCSGTSGGRKPEENQLTQVCLENILQQNKGEENFMTQYQTNARACTNQWRRRTPRRDPSRADLPCIGTCRWEHTWLVLTILASQAHKYIVPQKQVICRCDCE